MIGNNINFAMSAFKLIENILAKYKGHASSLLVVVTPGKGSVEHFYQFATAQSKNYVISSHVKDTTWCVTIISD